MTASRATPALPAQQTTGPYRITMACLGNICRSPVADVVMNDRLVSAGLDGAVAVDSCGTAGWHVGKSMDDRSAATLTAAGYDPTRHRAQQFRREWLLERDLVLAMDRSNLADLGGASERVRLFRDFDPLGPGGEVPDPYYGGAQGFEEVLAMVERTCDALLASLLTTVGRPGAGSPPLR
ncbi:MAG: low molecular weight protein-tyrosine-phosphatase [Nocardioides sp.]|uniref:low molecular weight protein-tyrosine-phosphatase n=1 Tax=Nocardioides sp. TaxID=35761 RepID=UPI003F0FC777